MIPETILIAAIATTLMTAFSYLISAGFRELYGEPLNDILFAGKFHLKQDLRIVND